MASVIIKQEICRTLKYKHPWIFSGAIKSIEGTPASGETVEIYTEKNELIGRGAYSPKSKIAIRMWSFELEEEITKEFFIRKISHSIESRKKNQILSTGNSVRLIFAESDGIPGLIVDKFADYLVCQFLSTGVEYHKKTIVEVLKELIQYTGIYERSDIDIREKEGLTLISGILAGKEPPEFVEIEENNLKFYVNIKNGHKTGFYLDQRINRSLVAEYAKDKEVLDCFTYTGGFSISTLKAEAKKVTSVDSSGPALEMLKKNIELNKLDTAKSELVEAKVAELLRKYRDMGKQFDMLILDPPKFIYDRSHLEQAMRAYKDINLLGIKLLKQGGILTTFSCSQPMEEDMFQKMISYAATDANKNVQILHKLWQSPDHPVAVNFPESAYLKGLICRIN